MNIISVTFIILVLTVVNNSNSSTFENRRCESFLDCKQGEFCLQSTNFCSPCVQCSKYGRENGTLYCSKTWKDCGNCLPGYSPKQQFDYNSTIARCSENIIGNKQSHTMDNTTGGVNLTPGWIVGIVFCACLILLVGSYAVHRYVMSGFSVARSDTGNRRWSSNSPPPPYANNDDHTSDGGGIVEGFQINVSGESNNCNKQKAVPFRNPSYLTRSCTGNHCNSDNGDSSSDNEEMQVRNGDTVTLDENSVNHWLDATAHVNESSTQLQTPAAVTNELEEVHVIPNASPPKKRQRLSYEDTNKQNGDGFRED